MDIVAMADTGTKRKLAAILSADVAGYSRLMASDEAATVRALNQARARFRERIAARGGRVVDTAGDSVLAEFASVVEAVECALEVQAAQAESNAPLPADRRMLFRIGVNLGDVIAQDDGTIYGDGVNIAARLEALAEPGTVVVSESAHMQVRGKLDVGFLDGGTHKVKNIAEPVRAWRVTDAADGTGGRPASAARGRRRLRAGAAALVAVVAAVAALWAIERPTPTAGRNGGPDTVPAAASALTLTVPDGPSIAVLPFTNMSEEAEQEYFSDGLTEDIITELSRIHGLFVIARNSTFQYKGRSVDVPEVARAFGVRYVVEGSVRRAGEQVRVTAQLIDAESGGHVWAERYDRELTDIFAVQDDITRQIVAALELELAGPASPAATRKLTDNVEAYDYFLRGRAYKDRTTRETNRLAEEMLDKAIALDPGFAGAYAELAYVFFRDWAYSWTDDADTLNKAAAAAEKAVALDPDLPLALARLAWVKSWQRQHDVAIAAGLKAIALDPNYADAYIMLSGIYVFAGEPDKAIAMAEKAMRLDPNVRFDLLMQVGHAHFLAGRHQQAVEFLKRSLERNPDFPAAHQILAAAYSELGRDEDGRAELAEVQRLSPKGGIDPERVPYKDPATLRRVWAAIDRLGARPPTD